MESPTMAKARCRAVAVLAWLLIDQFDPQTGQGTKRQHRCAAVLALSRRYLGAIRYCHDVYRLFICLFVNYLRSGLT